MIRFHPKLKSILLIGLITIICLPQLILAGWQPLPGGATDIGIGGNAIWIVGTHPVDGGYPIYKWTHKGWLAIPGGATAISVDTNGRPWVVNRNGGIFYFDNNGNWRQLPGAARDIGVGGNNSVWVIGIEPTNGGYQIFHWNGLSWDRVEGGGLRIAVDNVGNPWVVNASGDIFRYRFNHWQRLPGKAIDVAIGRDGAAWMVGIDSGIYHWVGNNWEKVDGSAVHIAVDKKGLAWVTNRNGGIFKYHHRDFAEGYNSKGYSSSGGQIKIGGHRINVDFNF